MNILRLLLLIYNSQFIYGTNDLENQRAFVTIFYDYGPDSESLLLATRVLMKSILDSNTKYHRIVILPKDKASLSTLNLLKHDGIRVISTEISNVFRSRPYVDNFGQLMHLKNLLVLWDDPILRSLSRMVYLDPENIVLRNMDEVFECADLCAVDNGQSVVYSNSLYVVNPQSEPARNVVHSALTRFENTGKAYGYVGVSQGFVPGLFEAFEESPFFDSNTSSRNNQNSIVKRLPFYYSINHMVYYERLNWDLYQCNNPNHNLIPGPVLSFKYSGATLKPWFWIGYVYFNIFWYWLDVRERLEEDHFIDFVTQLILSILFSVVGFYSFVTGYHYFHQKSFPVSSKVKRGTFMDFVCNVLKRSWLLRLVCSVCIVGAIHLMSSYTPPNNMHPIYACKLWLYWQNVLLIAVLFLLEVIMKNRICLLTTVILKNLRSLGLILCLEIAFLLSTNTKYYSNAVKKTIGLTAMLGIVIFFQLRILLKTFREHLDISSE